MSSEDDLIQWILWQVKVGEFDNQSAGVRKCILITKRVFENSTPEEFVKFVHGKKKER